MNVSKILKVGAIRVIGISILLCCPVVQAQTCRIDEIRFDPPQPRAGSGVNLDVSLLSSGNVRQQILVTLTVQIDSNSNFTIERGETLRTTIRANDNQTNDLNTSAGELTVPIYRVPQDHQPVKYMATVSCGTDRKSASIKVPTTSSTAVCLPPNLVSTILGIACLSGDVARNLGAAADKIRGGPAETYNGLNSIYLYSIADKSLRLILHDNDALYLAPNWSLDGKKLCFVINQSGKRRVAWITLEEKEPHIIADGSEDQSPFWLPDSTNIIFLRTNHLAVASSATNEARVIASSLVVDQILGVSKTTENKIRVFYEARNSGDPATKELYVLELDNQFRQLNVTQLVGDTRFYLIGMVSPAGDRAIYSQQSILFMKLISNDKTERLFEDEFKYSGPSWSPDGSRIVFVTSRP